MSDLISRQYVLDKFETLCDACGKRDEYNGVMCRCCYLDDGICIVEDAPSAEPEPEEFEWCHDCKEYDQGKHCCHRWTKVIRQTIVEVKQQYALEHPEIVHCNECFYAESADDKEDGYRCTHAMNRNRSVIWFGGDFCSYGEKNDE